MPLLSNLRSKMKNRYSGHFSSKSDSDTAPAAAAAAAYAPPPAPAPATRRPAPAAAADDPPPAYSPSAAHNPPPPTTTTPTAADADDPYAFLATFDTVFLIDDSGSMAGRSWRETAAALEAITPICTAHDADGIDVHFLNRADSAAHRNLTSPEAVARVFAGVRPAGGTPTGTRLHALLRPYLARCEARGCAAVKPLNVIVVTDGVPSDDVESVVCAAARRLDRLDAPAWQVGLQFFQVGDEPGAADALRELDDGLLALGCPRDMVDTVPWRPSSSDGAERQGLSAHAMLKVVLGAVNRRLDRRPNSRG